MFLSVLWKFDCIFVASGGGVDVSLTTNSEPQEQHYLGFNGGGIKTSSWTQPSTLHFVKNEMRP